ASARGGATVTAGAGASLTGGKTGLTTMTGGRFSSGVWPAAISASITPASTQPAVIAAYAAREDVDIANLSGSVFELKTVFSSVARRRDEGTRRCQPRRSRKMRQKAISHTLTALFSAAV